MDAKEFLQVRRAVDAIRIKLPHERRPSVGAFGAIGWFAGWGWPSVRIIALTEVQNCSVGTESYRLGKLVNAGYIVREVSTDDARMLYFSVTEQGRMLFVNAFVKSFGHVREMSPEEVKQKIVSFAEACSVPAKVEEVCLLSLIELGLPGVSDWGIRKLLDDELVVRDSEGYVLTDAGRVVADHIYDELQKIDSTIKPNIPRHLVKGA